MRSPRRFLGAVLAATGLLALAFAAPPAGADVLVLTDGSRLTTDGPWEVRNNLVVFHLPDGALSSLRADNVDLEASRTATEEAKKPKIEEKESEPEYREPIAVLTDADVARASPGQLRDEAAQAAGEAEEGDEAEQGEETAGDEQPSENGQPGEGEEAEEAEDTDPGLRVSDWEQRNSGEGGTTVVGTVRNEDDALATGIRLSITLVDGNGEVMATQQAEVGKTTLVPGASTDFRAEFPDVIGFAQVRFETGSIPLQYERGTVGQDDS